MQNIIKYKTDGTICYVRPIIIKEGKKLQFQISVILDFCDLSWSKYYCAIKERFWEFFIYFIHG